MTLLRPFRALRPNPEQAAAVSAVPYDVVSTGEARALAANNPLSFLHVSRAEIDLPDGTDPYAPEVYETAVRNFERLRAGAPLVQDTTPGLYFYRLRMGAHEQTGLAACFSLDEYERDAIRKHERTRKDKEDDRTRHIVEVRAQTGPVFLTYVASARVDGVATRVVSGEPLFDFRAPDGVQHSVWRVGDADAQALAEAFGAIPALYIADGHHRAASAMRARQELRRRAGNGGAPEADWFLAVAFPHDQTQILPYNRLVKDLAGASPQSLLDALRARCTVEPGGDVPSRPGRVAMYLGGRWYQVTLAPPSPAASPSDRLDVSLLQDQVLSPLLGIADVRTDKRIEFVGGIRGTAALTRAVEDGEAAVAFSLRPVGVSDLMAIADAGGIMPPKSTWFEPKLRDGLLSHLI